MAPGDQGCDGSPFCSPVRLRVMALGLAPDLPWRWIHLGPIGPHGIPLVEHRGRCWRTDRTVSSDGPIGRFGGYHLDLLGMPSAPIGTGASFQATAGLWFVYGVAWRDPSGPRAEWEANQVGPGELRLLLGADGLRPDFWAIAGRCADLLSGRLARRGHPLADSTEAWRNYELAVKAEEIKARDPGLPYSVIASSLGVSERALRSYRATAARWHRSTETRRLA